MLHQILRSSSRSARAFSTTNMTLAAKPTVKPASPDFSSGPCKKRPGWSLDQLSNGAYGRSHRSAIGKEKLKKCIDDSRRILGVPDDYYLGIVPVRCYLFYIYLQLILRTCPRVLFVPSCFFLLFFVVVTFLILFFSLFSFHFFHFFHIFLPSHRVCLATTLLLLPPPPTTTTTTTGE